MRLEIARPGTVGDESVYRMAPRVADELGTVARLLRSVSKVTAEIGRSETFQKRLHRPSHELLPNIAATVAEDLRKLSVTLLHDYLVEQFFGSSHTASFSLSSERLTLWKG
jgi:hypothetical protein